MLLLAYCLQLTAHLLNHGDGDRNIRFNQTTDLVRRLEKAGVPFGKLIIPDDTHHFIGQANSVKENAAVAAFSNASLA